MENQPPATVYGTGAALPGAYRVREGAPPPDIRLIAADLDGTLLDDRHELHDHLWPLIAELHRRGILFCPASGRQYYNLRHLFRDVADDLVFIAENGAYVVEHEREISSNGLSAVDAAAIVGEVRGLLDGGPDAGIVVCGKRSAYTDRADPAFVDAVSQYFVRLQVVGDVLDAIEADAILKISVFDFGFAEQTIYPLLARSRESHQVTIGSEHWIDIMSRTANKGQALRDLQQSRGITAAQTMVFGDFLNDLEMMDAADYAFAMGNAHPTLRARARFVAPSNLENGVVRTISTVLGLNWSE